MYRYSQKIYSHFIEISQVKGHFDYLSEGYSLIEKQLIVSNYDIRESFQNSLKI